jgi:dienelactone hydrolase
MRFPLLLCLLTAIPAWAEEIRLPAQIRMPLWSAGVPDGRGGVDASAKPMVTFHRAPEPDGTVIVVCPGGGYGGLVTDAEGHGIARWLNGHGISAVVLEYRLPAGRSEVPLLDAKRAIRLARHHAADWGVKTNRVGIVGFSAGGHLAATAATLFDAGDSGATDPVERLGSRPDFAILVYPVITMGPEGHQGSRENLLGKYPGPELLKRFSAERQVTSKTPPVFLAHAVDDRVVDIGNSRMMAASLQSAGVPHALVELPDGDHGLNGYKGASWDRWQRESLEWIRSRLK